MGSFYKIAFSQCSIKLTYTSYTTLVLTFYFSYLWVILIWKFYFKRGLEFNAFLLLFYIKGSMTGLLKESSLLNLYWLDWNQYKLLLCIPDYYSMLQKNMPAIQFEYALNKIIWLINVYIYSITVIVIDYKFSLGWYPSI